MAQLRHLLGVRAGGAAGSDMHWQLCSMCVVAVAACSLVKPIKESELKIRYRPLTSAELEVRLHCELFTFILLSVSEHPRKARTGTAMAAGAEASARLAMECRPLTGGHGHSHGGDDHGHSHGGSRGGDANHGHSHGAALAAAATATASPHGHSHNGHGSQQQQHQEVQMSTIAEAERHQGATDDVSEMPDLV